MKTLPAIILAGDLPFIYISTLVRTTPKPWFCMASSIFLLATGICRAERTDYVKSSERCVF